MNFILILSTFFAPIYFAWNSLPLPLVVLWGLLISAWFLWENKKIIHYSKDKAFGNSPAPTIYTFFTVFMLYIAISVIFITLFTTTFYITVSLKNPSSTPENHSYNSNYRYTGLNCGFTVSFPDKPKVELFTDKNAGDYEQASWVSPNQKDGTLLRTECLHIPKANNLVETYGPKKFILEQLDTYATNNGIQPASMKYEFTGSQHKGVGRGVKNLRNLPYTVTVTLIVGENSILTMITAGFSKNYPSKEVTPFLKSVSDET